VLALAESGLPQQFSRLLQPEEFDGGLRVPIASHVHRDARTGGRILFGVEHERATWQHDLGVTASRIAFIESPTEFSEFFVEEGSEETSDVAVPYRWTPGAPGGVGVVDRAGDGSSVRWANVDPCLVTHVLHAYDEEPAGASGGG